MYAVMVVVQSPAINHPASFLEAQEDFTVQQLIAKRGLSLDLSVAPFIKQLIDFQHANDGPERSIKTCF